MTQSPHSFSQHLLAVGELAHHRVALVAAQALGEERVRQPAQTFAPCLDQRQCQRQCQHQCPCLGLVPKILIILTQLMSVLVRSVMQMLNKE